jgi:hypothetical protein
MVDCTGRQGRELINTLQFPLSILAFGRDHYERLESACCFAIYATGMHRRKVLSPVQIDKELEGQKRFKPVGGVTTDDLTVFMLGCAFCGVTRPENGRVLVWRINRYRAVQSFLAAWNESGQTSPWTRVPAQMLFEARDGGEKNYQRFAALCAVNAAIGSKPFAVVTRNRLRAGMLGYSSGRLLFDDFGDLSADGRALLALRQDQQREAISTSQARTLLDNFVRQGLLHRFTPYRGSLTYFSKILPAEKIAEELLARVQRTGRNQKLNQLGEMIRQAKLGLLCGDVVGKSPHNGDSPHNRETATQSPPDHRPIATQSPLNAATFAAKNASLHASLMQENVNFFESGILASKKGTQEPDVE